MRTIALCLLALALIAPPVAAHVTYDSDDATDCPDDGVHVHVSSMSGGGFCVAAGSSPVLA